MNFFEKILYFLQGEMVEPKAFGLFHLLWLVLVVIVICILYTKKSNYGEKQLKLVLGVYGIIALILEVLKQLIWSFNYDVITNNVIWDFEWYAFPFQLCTTPIYISLICLLLKKGKIRDSLLAYLSYITIIGSITTMIMPDSCFVSDILVNIHTMWLHLGSFVVSVYLLLNKEVELNFYRLKQAIIVFLIFVFIALTMNIIIYNLGILNGETFNMFYISPYFISSLPIFDVIQKSVPYIIFLLIYILSIILASFIIFGISKLISSNILNNTKL